MVFMWAGLAKTPAQGLPPCSDMAWDQKIISDVIWGIPAAMGNITPASLEGDPRSWHVRLLLFLLIVIITIKLCGRFHLKFQTKTKLKTHLCWDSRWPSLVQTTGRPQALLGTFHGSRKKRLFTNGVVPRERGEVVICEILEEIRLERRRFKWTLWYTPNWESTYCILCDGGSCPKVSFQVWKPPS